MTTSSDHPPPQLEYAQRPHRAWLGRHRRKVISLALLLAIAGPIWWNWQSLKRRVLWLYWFHQASAHVMPPPSDTSLFGPEETKFAATNPAYLLRLPTLPNEPASGSYAPAAFRELVKLDGRLQTMGRADGPVIFMGTLRRHDGTPRLVVITGSSDRDFERMMLDPGVAVLPLPGWFDPLPPTTGIPVGRTWTMKGSGSNPAVYRTAAIDPRDPTHIVIQYTVSPIWRTVASGIPEPRKILGQGEVDAYLQNDDSLRFVLRGPGQLGTTQIGGLH